MVRGGVGLWLLCAVLSAPPAVRGGEGYRAPIPLLPVRPGTRYSSDTRATDTPLQLEVFLELNCPDSAAAWPVIRALQEHYGPQRLDLLINHFPLPYHRNGMLSTQAYYLVQDKQPDQQFVFMSKVFDHLNEYSTSFSANLTRDDIIHKLAGHVAEVTSLSEADVRRDIDDYRRTAVYRWKYGARRGVAGVPWFFLNGIDLWINPNNHSLSLDDWKVILDPLVGVQSTTPSGTTADVIAAAARMKVSSAILVIGLFWAGIHATLH